MAEDDQPPAPRSRAYHHGDLRNALIAAGQALLAEEGAAGIDLRNVARRAGVSHAAPYRHFADKQALLAAIAEQGFRQLTTQVQAAIDAAPNEPRAQLLGMARAYVQFACDSPAHMREMFSGFTIDRAAYPTLYAASKAAFGAIVAVVAYGQTRGEFVAGDPAQLTLATWALVHGLTMLLIENQIPGALGNPAMIESTIQLCMRTLYEGLERH